MRPFLLVICLVTGCAAHSARDPYQRCPIDARDWHILSTPPASAQEILALAENPSAKGKEHHWFWFSNDVGEIALCDAANLSEFEARLFNPDCFSVLSVFGKSGEHWHGLAGRDIIVVCGNE